MVDEKVIERLTLYSNDFETKHSKAYKIKINGKFVKSWSTKRRTVWGTKGAAMQALDNIMYGIPEETVKELFDCKFIEIIEFVER